jgi:UPF0271 protein
MMSPYSIDINCDMAEGVGNEKELMPFISSANIACGFHAGNEELMKETVELCLKYKVSIGAHPSFPDRENFGRTSMELPPSRVIELVAEQVLLLKKIADRLGAKLHHVKPHGALYNMAARDPALAHSIAYGVKQIDSSLIVYGLSHSLMIREAVTLGLKVANEVFADRTYQPDGSLTSRMEPDALISDEQKALTQAIRFVRENKVMTVSGEEIRLTADTICLHGDGKHAVEFARIIYERMNDAGIIVKSMQ